MTKKVFRVDSIEVFSDLKIKSLSFSDSHNYFAYLDNNYYNNNLYSNYEALVAMANKGAVSTKKNDKIFDALDDYLKTNPNSWLFGCFGYDLKNELENLNSNNLDFQEAPNISLFSPEILILFHKDLSSIEIIAPNPTDLWDRLLESDVPKLKSEVMNLNIQKRISKEDYIETVKIIKNHIIDGDVYEINYCQEFYSENADLDPVSVFFKLNQLNPSPFAAFYKFNHHSIICASPERFLHKNKSLMISQPIKGTIRRGMNPEEDILLRDELYNSEKDRAENVMIVDLVRNDLGRCAKIGTVEVEELFGIYSFPQVWQMISTVKAEVEDSVNLVSIIKAAFPPGSMTGAPKVISMKLIERFEKSKRGVYSGALGYFSPGGNFDFNVLIRSIFYNSDLKRLSFQTGGAIVYDSDPEKEYEECLLKAKAMYSVLNT